MIFRLRVLHQEDDFLDELPNSCCDIRDRKKLETDDDRKKNKTLPSDSIFRMRYIYEDIFFRELGGMK